MIDALTPDEALDRALMSLQPDSERFVIIGGWALRLLATRSEAAPLGRELLVTTDLDVAIRSPASPTDPPVGERLARAGFKARMSGDARPPATGYVIDTISGPFSVEFVGQRRGGLRLRGDRIDATRSRLGVVVQLLPHLELALASTWSVSRRITASGDVGDRVVEVRVPSPVSYVVQKLVSMQDRPSVRKRERDLLYIVDALSLFSDVLADIADSDRKAIATSLSRGQRLRLRGRIVELGEVRDIHRGAAVQARAAGFVGLDDPRILALACRRGLSRLGDF